MKKFLFIIFCLLSLGIYAQVDKVIPDAPQPPKLVNDFTKTLSQLQEHDLEAKLKNYDDTTSNQIVVVIVDKLGGYDPYEYAIALGRKWGVGNKQFNNGVVLLVAKGDRKVFIAPGYGLEGAMPDVICKQIVDYEILPGFKGNDYYGGIARGTDAIMKAAAGEYKVPEGYAGRGGKKGIPVFAVIIAIVVIVVIISSITGGGGGGSYTSRRGYRDSGVPPIFWFPGGGGGGSRGGGGWSGGGSGGGGFGGFGGGSFGGGGAGGSW